MPGFARAFTLRDMLCPREGTELKTVKRSDVELEECSACGGVFLDRGELESLQSAVEKAGGAALGAPTDTVSEGFSAAHNEELPPIDCVKCTIQMERRRYGFGSQTVIDECPNCGGLWLDGGELEALQKLYATSNAENPIPIWWRLYAMVRGPKAKPTKAK